MIEALQPGARLEWLDLLAAGAIAYLALMAVGAPLLGRHLRRRRRQDEARQQQEGSRHGQAPRYRPPREYRRSHPDHQPPDPPG